jgi:hypothetical protein
MKQTELPRIKRSRPPQRISVLSPPGSRLKRPFEIATRIRLREASERDPTYLSRIRQCPCLRCGMDPCGMAAHVRMGCNALGKKTAGTGRKPADRWAVPLCGDCHLRDNDSQHKVGERQFWYGVGINPLLVCQHLWVQREDLMAMRAAIFAVVAEREQRSQIEGNGGF